MDVGGGGGGGGARAGESGPPDSLPPPGALPLSPIILFYPVMRQALKSCEL